MKRDRAETVRRALRRLRRQAARDWGVPAIVQAARELLEDRHEKRRQELQLKGEYEPLSCICKLDRVMMTTAELPSIAFSELPGYRFGKPNRLWGAKKLYQYSQRIRGTGSVREVVVESDPKKKWLPEYRLTIIPRDSSGLEPQDLQEILGMFEQYKLTLLEAALDFPLDSIVDVAYVRRFGLAGKSWLPLGPNPLHDKWGSAKTPKVVRSYPKWEISAHRLELELHSRFLRKHKINRPSDFPQLAKILPRNHVYFARLDKQKLSHELQLRHKTGRDVKIILEHVKDLDDSLWRQLRYLRRKGLVNVLRLVKPLKKVNRVLREAIEKWATQWTG